MMLPSPSTLAAQQRRQPLNATDEGGQVVAPRAFRTLQASILPGAQTADRELARLPGWAHPAKIPHRRGFPSGNT